MLISIISLAILGIAVEAMTEIIVAAKITDGLREWVFRKAHPGLDKQPQPGPWLAVFVNEMLKCGYCTSVWVAMVAACFAPTWFPASGETTSGETTLAGLLASWVVDVLVLHRLSNWLHVLFMLVKKGRIRTYDIELKQTVESVVRNGSD